MLTLGGRLPFRVSVVVARPLAAGRLAWAKTGEEDATRVATRATRPALDMIGFWFGFTWASGSGSVSWNDPAPRSLLRNSRFVTPWKLPAMTHRLNHVPDPSPPGGGGLDSHLRSCCWLNRAALLLSAAKRPFGS